MSMETGDAETYDVAVVGGGAAGVAAAIGAARLGARTLLLEQMGFLGGAATARNVLTYCGLFTLGETPKQAVRGVADNLLDGLRRLNAVTGPVRHRGVFVVFDPEAVKLTLDRLCTAAGVDVFLHSFVSEAQREGDAITSIVFDDHGGRHGIRAKAWVDASGDCDLATFAGASVRYGNGSHVNLGTLGTRYGGIPAGVEIDAERFKQAVDQARASGRPLTKDLSLFARLPISGDICCYLASADYDPRDVRSLSKAEAEGRVQAYEYLEILRTMPGCERAYLVSTGPEFGTRESRHINAVEQLKWQDVRAGRERSDTVALGAWGVEWHDRETFESTFEAPPGGAAYSIPLDCLRSRDTANLFAAGRTADGDQQAGASLRVMGTSFATGQAAGVAASLFASDGTVDVRKVQSALRDQDAVLDPRDMLEVSSGR
jgi:hypothetical protein